MQATPWWRGAVIYQVYPRSLMDSNDDGIGDLPGIINKLDYISSLGVDAIWISPFFKSPMKDFGYDISDYRSIDPIFGDLDDFDRLIVQAHALGIKIIIDQVLSHTSDQHQWFQQSRESRTNEKADWYVWVDPSDDGTPPNNWLSIFGGSAWEWEPRRGQYFLHNFLKSQPDLNFHCAAVRQQILDEVEFWLTRGVDGLRLDAINFCYHDQQLRSNPSKPIEMRKGRGFREDNPYAFQTHIYDNTRPENLEFLQALRVLMDRYPGSVTLGEISSDNSLATMAEYTSDRRLHMAYSFELLVDTLSASYIRQTVETLEENLAEGWPCWSIGNHDVVRVMSRWGGTEPSDDMAKMLNALLLSLRGSVCSYQGEELGLTEANIEQHQLRDPYGVAFWPMFKGRDGCRTPMPWEQYTLAAGFSQGTKSWLPIPAEHHLRAVDTQEKNPDSVLNAYRKFMQWRKQQPALRLGSIKFLNAPDSSLLFIRAHEGQQLIAAFNLSAEPVSLEINAPIPVLPLEGHGFESSVVENQMLKLPAFGVFFGQLN